MFKIHIFDQGKQVVTNTEEIRVVSKTYGNKFGRYKGKVI